MHIFDCWLMCFRYLHHSLLGKSHGHMIRTKMSRQSYTESQFGKCILDRLQQFNLFGQLWIFHPSHDFLPSCLVHRSVLMLIVWPHHYRCKTCNQSDLPSLSLLNIMPNLLGLIVPGSRPWSSQSRRRSRCRQAMRRSLRHHGMGFK